MKWKEIYSRLVGIPIVALFAIYVYPEHRAELPFYQVYLISLVFTSVYWNGAVYIMHWSRKQYSGIGHTKLRLLVQFLGVFIWMAIGGIPIKLLFGLSTIQEAFLPSEHTKFIPFNFVAASIVSLSYEAFYFFDKWKEAFQQNEQLKNQQVRTQYEVLQNQMSPHFLFNSLNTLASIIPDDQEAAVAFTEKLSEVYRYILQNKERELVPLDEEIDFVRAYIFLLKMRYPDNLNVTFKIDTDYNHRAIPPLTIQMLVENAIKHNIISKAKPLHIDIYTENGQSILVKNNLQLKNTLGKSTKTGLDNISKRYTILGGRKIDVITSMANFIVAVPLIDMLEEKDLSIV